MDSCRYCEVTPLSDESEKYHVTVETWQPEDAEKALAHNHGNRFQSPTVVQRYARDMREGEWPQALSIIVFDNTGRLADGQHRLAAQVLTDTVQTWIVKREIEVEDRSRIDLNQVRTSADALRFAGEENSALLAATVKIAYAVNLNGFQGSRQAASVAEVERTLGSHPEIRGSVEMASWFNKKRLVPLAPSVVGAAHWMIMQKNGREEADNFIRRLATLAGEEEGSPVLALASRLGEVQRAQTRVHARDLLNAVLKAWNADVEGRYTQRISLYGKSKVFKLSPVKVRPRTESSTEDEGEATSEAS